MSGLSIGSGLSSSSGLAIGTGLGTTGGLAPAFGVQPLVFAGTGQLSLTTIQHGLSAATLPGAGQLSVLPFLGLRATETMVGAGLLSAAWLALSSSKLNGAGLVSAATVIPPALFDGTATNVTLTNNNRTAQHTNTTNNSGAASASFLSSGKYYFEVTATAFTGASTSLGVILNSGSFTNMASGQNCAINFQASGGQIWANNANSGKVDVYSPGDTVGVAVDLDNHLIWFRNTNQSLWNNTGGADPATATGGVTIASGSYAPAVCFSGTGSNATEVMTGNFGNAAFVLTVPSGFYSGWPKP